MGWNKGQSNKKEIINIKEKEILTVDKKGKLIKRELITEVFANDGNTLERKVHLIQGEKPGKVRKILNSIPLIKNARSIKIIEEPDKITITNETGRELDEEV